MKEGLIYQQFVSFNLGKEEYGIAIENVDSVIRLVELSDLPNAPDFILGVINLRGKIIPVIDLRKRFELPVKEFDQSTRIIIINIGDKNIGLIVDEVSQVIKLSEKDIEPAENLNSIYEEYIFGVGRINNRLIVCLDIEKILTAEERIEISKLHNEVNKKNESYETMAYRQN